MGEMTWTKSGTASSRTNSKSLKFIIAGIVFLGLVVVLITQALSSSQQFFITLAEYHANPAHYSTRDFRMSAWVDGSSIQFNQIDATHSRLEFDLVDNVVSPTYRLRIVTLDEPKPDLLQDKAQAIVEGSIGADGALYTRPDGLLLKCPTRYEEGAPVKE